MDLYSLDEKIYKMVDNSEGIEGFKYDSSNVIGSSGTEDLLENISRETVLEFLQCESTKVYVVKDEQNNGYKLVAHNAIAKESIMIEGLGDHMVALIKMVEHADLKHQELKENKNAELISHDFIKAVNAQVLCRRSEEVAIGKYRTVDNFNNPVEVQLCNIVDGRKVKIPYITLETSVNNNVINKMDELVDWVNTKAFKGDGCLKDVAEFHARFIQIHPFRDGNGRTVRLLTNYLLLATGHNMLSIPSAERDMYKKCLNYANAVSEEAFIADAAAESFYNSEYANGNPRTDENKYLPLAKFFNRYVLRKDSNQIVSSILNYKDSDESCKNLSAKQI